MFKLIIGTWHFLKETISFIAKFLGIVNGVLGEFNDNLENFNHELNIKNALLKIKSWGKVINKYKAQIPNNYQNVSSILKETSMFTGQAIVILEEVLDNPILHEEFSALLDDFENEFNKFTKSKEYKKIIKHCRSQGLESHSEPLKVFDFYFKISSFAGLDLETESEQQILLVIQKANKQAKKINNKLLTSKQKNKQKIQTQVVDNKKIPILKSQIKNDIKVSNLTPKQVVKPPLEGFDESVELHLFEAVFITNSNESKIVSKIDLRGSPKDFDCLYDKSISFMLSIPELNLLHIYKELCSHPKEAFSAYKKLHKKDTKRFVWEGGTPAYHFKDDCTRLNSEFTNLSIPVEIQEKGVMEIEKFREFVKKYKELLDENESKFLEKLETRFFLKNPPKSVKFQNSGVHTFENCDLSKLKSQIDSLIETAKNFRDSDEEILKLIKDLGYGTHKVKEAKDPKNPLYEWHNLKTKLKTLLRQYYRVKFNPELKFEKNLLEQIGFQACKECSR